MQILSQVRNHLRQRRARANFFATLNNNESSDNELNEFFSRPYYWLFRSWNWDRVMEVSHYFVISMWNNLFSGSREFQEFEWKTIWKSRSDIDRAALIIAFQFDRSSMRTHRYNYRAWIVTFVCVAPVAKESALAIEPRRESPSNCERLASVEVYQSVSEGLALIFHRFQFAVVGISQPLLCANYWTISAFILPFGDRRVL